MAAAGFDNLRDLVTKLASAPQSRRWWGRAPTRIFARMRRTRDQCFALLAAYALALQAVLAFAIPLPLAPPDAGFAICGADDAGAPAVPPHRACPACLSGQCAGPSGEPERAAFATPWRRVVRTAETPWRGAVATVTPGIHAHAPRAPPG